MKRCPECRRDYYDDSLLYCLDDGSALLEGPASGDEPATAIFSGSEDPTRAKIKTTERSAISPREEEPRKSSGEISAKRSISANLAAKPLAMLGIAVLLLIGGFFAYRYLS